MPVNARFMQLERGGQAEQTQLKERERVWKEIGLGSGGVIGCEWM